MSEEFNPQKFMESRNAGSVKSEPIDIPEKPATETDEPTQPVEVPAKAAEPEVETDHSPRLSRSQRREMNRLREQAAEERGRRMALESMIAERNGAPKAQQPAVSANGEPQRGQFDNDMAYVAAVAKWQAKQEAAHQAASASQTAELQAEIAAATEARNEHVALIPDWDAVVDSAEDLELGEDQIPLQFMLATSDVSAFVIEHLVNHPKDWEKLIGLKRDETAQRRFFARLEGRAEIVYNSRLKAAQASKDEAPKKDRSEAAKEEKPVAKKVLPKPSSEVAVKGGIAPPGEPKIGSAEWMELRNRAKSTSRY